MCDLPSTFFRKFCWALKQHCACKCGLFCSVERKTRDACEAVRVETGLAVTGTERKARATKGGGQPALRPAPTSYRSAAAATALLPSLGRVTVTVTFTLPPTSPSTPDASGFSTPGASAPGACPCPGSAAAVAEV
jgi:hypothetical protein